jgi:hypothetical protein
MTDNIHVDTNSKAPEDWSETEKMLALVQYWYRWNEVARKSLIDTITMQPYYWCDPLAGINVSVLNGLEEIDPEKLAEELSPILK